MSAIDGYLKREKKEMIDDLVRAFSPISDKVTKPYVKFLYENCFNAIIKEKPYVREAMSLAKILAAKQLEDMIKKDAGITDEPEADIKVLETGESLPRVKSKFIP